MDCLNKINELLEKYESSGVISTSGLTAQLGEPSAEVLLTGGIGKKKKKKFIMKADAEGLITTVNGKKLKLTGLSDKEKNEYLFGDTKIEKAASYADMMIEYIQAHTSPELEEDDGSLEKCDKPSSKLIKDKEGVWRRIRGRPVFICEDGTIHAGPKIFIGKKASTLRDELRAEKKKKSRKTGK